MQSICISRPLSTIDCSGAIPVQPGINPGRFYQYSIEIGSTNSFDMLLRSYNGALKDEFSLAPAGWSQWLRDDAFKVFLEITDDESALSEGRSSCSSLPCRPSTSAVPPVATTSGTASSA